LVGIGSLDALDGGLLNGGLLNGGLLNGGLLDGGLLDRGLLDGGLLNTPSGLKRVRGGFFQEKKGMAYMAKGNHGAGYEGAEMRGG
jgi:hypothetical protein